VNNKIGIGITTCNRTDFFEKCLNSIPTDHLTIIVNDGQPFESLQANERPNCKFIQNPTNLGVGKSKNILFKELLEQGCEHIFLIEDDIVIKDSGVFDAYIKARNVTGIQHFMFGYHGPANRFQHTSKGRPDPRYIIEYTNDVKIAINRASVGAFSYYTKEVLETVGFIDEEYLNAFEHVDHDYRIAKAGFSTPYWNWADLANSYDYLDELACSEESSTIRPRADWKENIIKGVELFQSKHGYSPAWNNAVPDTSKENVKLILKEIYKKHKNEN
jgi:GT2 family glycosyltransferase